MTRSKHKPDPRLKPWPPEAVKNSPLFQFEIGPMQNLVYLAVDWNTKQAAWIDPQKDLDPLLTLLQAHGLSLSAIWLTHTHADHVAGLNSLMIQFPEVPILLHEKDAFRLKLDAASQSRLRYIQDQELFTLGNLQIRAWHMPGHSAGAMSFEIAGDSKRPPLLLTGDTLFIRDCGRTDLPTGNTSEMFESLDRYRQFSDNTVILPGHHYQEEWWSTLAQEWKESPPFQCRSAQELEALP